MVDDGTPIMERGYAIRGDGEKGGGGREGGREEGLMREMESDGRTEGP